jgi:FAD/FMN-containing dehydrogenase
VWTNWSGGQQSRPRATDRPLDEAGVVAAVLRAADREQRIRPVGARWSWSPLAVTDEVQLDTSALTGVVAFDDDQVRVRAGEKLQDLLPELAGHGLTLAGVPRGEGVTVGGAVSTGTHGSGAAVGSMSSLVRAVRIVDGTGELRTIDGPDLDAVRTGLGALGILTEVDLAVVPEQTLAAFEQLRPLAALLEEGFLDGHHWTELEVFPDGHALARWADPVDPTDSEASGVPAERGVAGRAVAVGSAAAVGSAHALSRVVPRLAPTLRRSASRWSGSTTGPAHRVLVVERPVRAEVSEWALPREALGHALRELDAATAARDVVPRMPVLVRTGASETGWLHPAHGRATAWVAVRVRRGSDPEPLFGLVASVLGDVGGRPHWGTRHDWTAADVGAAYPRAGDFHRVRDRLDPDRRLTNPHLESLLGP